MTQLIEEEPKLLVLSERWTKIANILPASGGLSFGHVDNPHLLINPKQFLAVVQKSLKTCEEFLTTLQDIEDGLEKRIRGITSYYSIVVAIERDTSYQQYGGLPVSVSGATVSLNLASTNDGAYAMVANSDYERPQRKPQTKKQVTKTESAIFERHGDAIIYNHRMLSDPEIISFNMALNILTKLYSMRKIIMESIAKFGSVEEVLSAGDVFSTTTKIDYYEEHALQTSVTRELIPIDSYWSTLSSVNRMRALNDKLKPHLQNLLPKTKKKN